MCKYSVKTIAAQAGNHIDDKKRLLYRYIFLRTTATIPLKKLKILIQARVIHIPEFRLLIVEHLNKQWQSLKPVSVVLL